MTTTTTTFRVSSHPAGDWTERAACLHADPEVFHPPIGGNPGRVHVEAAVPWCSACPVIAECYATAVRTGSTGIWGGHLFTYRGHPPRSIWDLMTCRSSARERRRGQ